MTQEEKKIPSPEEEKLFSESLDWEVTRIMQLEKSERRAWRVATMFGCGMLLAWLTVMLLMPLKTTIPYLVRVDNNTGITDIVTVFDSKDVTFEEVNDKHWLSRYVGARERYDWYTIQEDYDTVGLLSSREVGNEYASQFSGADAMDKVYGNKVKKLVKINSISFNPNQDDLATVRFSVTTKRTDAENNNTAPARNYVATISYEYQDTSKMKESDRLKNPFGFQVLSYRTDTESQ